MKNCFLTCAALALLLVAPASLRASDFAGILDKTAPAIVTVKVVLKMEISMMGQAQNEESRSEMPGVVVDSSGLIMISNAEISSDRMQEALAGAGLPGQVDLKVTPNDFKVIFGNEEKEHAAFLVATDTKLDLAFLQVENTEGLTMTPVSFADAPKAAVGQSLVSISRLKKGYDYAPYFTTGRISGAIKKPRKAWIVDGSIGSYGLPVFSEDGAVLGVLVTLTPTTTEASDGAGIGMLMRMMRGAGGNDGPVGTFILPAKIANRVIEQSKTKAAELRKEHAEKKAAEGDAGAGG